MDKKLEEIYWQNYKEAVARLGVLGTFLFILGCTISIYLRETVDQVVGVPDPVTLFGVPVTRGESFVTVIIIYLTQWLVLLRIIYLRKKLNTPGCELESCRALLLGRQLVLNPFAQIDGRLSTLSSVFGLVVFLTAVFVFPTVLLPELVDDALGVLGVIVVLYTPILGALFANVYKIDSRLVSRRHAIFRSSCAVVYLMTFTAVQWVGSDW